MECVKIWFLEIALLFIFRKEEGGERDGKGAATPKTFVDARF